MKAKTLVNWLALYPSVYCETLKSGAKQIFHAHGLNHDAKWDLFHLTDYAVSSSVSGPSYILAPRDVSQETDGMPDDGDPSDPRTHSLSSRETHAAQNNDLPTMDRAEDLI